VLSASHRVLRPGGRLAFHVIEPTPGLARPARRRAHRVGPEAVAVSTSYENLLRSAGFVDISVTELTSEYAFTLGRWIEASERRESAIREVVGSDVFEERATSRLERLRAIEDGILARTQYAATRP